MSDDVHDARLDWTAMRVWAKNGRPYICHATDGDECIGPFPSEDDAERALAALRAPAAGSQVWMCAKCGHGSEEHGMEGHPAFGCVADMRLAPAGSGEALAGLLREYRDSVPGCLNGSNCKVCFWCRADAALRAGEAP